MKKIALIAALFLSACSPPQNPYAVLEAEGYTDIDYVGVELFACSKDQWFRNRYSARSIAGRHVEVAVCQPIFGGASVRVVKVYKD